MQSCNLEFGFQGKMIELGGFVQPFDLSTEDSNQTVGLSRHSLGRGFFQRCILLERLMGSTFPRLR